MAGQQARRAPGAVPGAPRRAARGRTPRPSGSGLSATVRPVEEVATFLGGTRRGHRGAAAQPQADRAAGRRPGGGHDRAGHAAPGRGSGGDDEESPAPRRSIWPHVEERVLDLIEQHKSTIVFANSRRLAERLCGRLNELAAERAERGGRAEAKLARTAARRPRSWRRPEPPRARPRRSPGRITARCPGRSGPRSRRRSRRAGCPPWWPPPAWSWASTWARWTWSSRSSRRRRWPAGCSGSAGPGTTWATSPAASSSPSTRATWSSRPWWPSACGPAPIEELKIPHNPLDVLAQQIVAMTAVDDWLVDELEQTVRRAAPFGGLTRPILEAVLDMLAGRYPSEEFAGLRPRMVWDRVAGTIRGPARRPAAGRHQRRHDPRPRAVRRVPAPSGYRQAAAPGRRARRGDGVRVAGRRRVRARRQLVADRGHHAGPGAGHARAGAAGQAAVLARRHARGGPPSSAGPSARPAASCPRPGTRKRRPSWSGPGLTRWRRGT